MYGLELTLEIGKRLYERARVLTRSGIIRAPRTQVADEAREEALGGPHRLKREVRDVVAHALGDTAHLLPRERAEVDMPQDELGAFDIAVETVALSCEHPDAAAGLITHKRDKAPEQCERSEDKDEVPHG